MNKYTKLLIAVLLLLPLTVGALPTVFDQATKLVFTAPTENTDGSPLTDLAGFKVYWSSTQGGYTDANSQLFNDSTITEILLSDITFSGDGDYFIVMTAINSAGFESEFSTVGYAKKLDVVFYKDQSAGAVPGAPFNLVIQ